MKRTVIAVVLLAVAACSSSDTNSSDNEMITPGATDGAAASTLAGATPATTPPTSAAPATTTVSPTTPPTATPPTSNAPVTTIVSTTTSTTTTPVRAPRFRFGPLDAGVYRTDVFPVAVTLELGDGWTGLAPENRFRIDLAHESGGRFVLDVAKAESTLDEVMDQLQADANLQEGGLEVMATSEISIAGSTGLRAVATIADGNLKFVRALTKPRSQEFFLVLQIPVTLWIDVLDVNGTTLVVYAEAPPQAFGSFAVDVIEPIHASMTIGGWAD